MFYFDSLADFFQMGKHGVYVWSAYIISLVGIIFFQINISLKQKKLRKQLAQIKRNSI